MMDAGRVVATLELDTQNYMRGVGDAIEAAGALGLRARGAADGVGTLSGAMAGLREAAQGGARGALDALDGLRAGAVSAGRAAADGLIAGAGGRRSAVVAQFRSLARAAIQAARSELGIASPSKVFAEIGANAARGFELGIDRNMHGARESMRRLTALGAFTPRAVTGARQTGGVVNNHYNSAPISVTFPGAVVRNDGDLRALERDMQRIARDLQYGLGARS